MELQGSQLTRLLLALARHGFHVFNARGALLSAPGKTEPLNSAAIVEHLCEVQGILKPASLLSKSYKPPTLQGFSRTQPPLAALKNPALQQVSPEVRCSGKMGACLVQISI